MGAQRTDSMVVSHLQKDWRDFVIDLLRDYQLLSADSTEVKRTFFETAANSQLTEVVWGCSTGKQLHNAIVIIQKWSFTDLW